MLLATMVFAGCAGPTEEPDDDREAEDPGQDPDESSSQTENETEAPSLTKEVSASGNWPANPGFDPERMEVPAGTNLTVVLTNDDITAEHAWRLEGVSDAATGNVAPGESGEVTFLVPEPGEYVYYCPVGNHRQLGQEGVLEVTA